MENAAVPSGSLETKGPPASLAGFEDRALFSLLVNDQSIGHMNVAWEPDGCFTSETVIEYAGQTIQTSVAITPDAEGRWREIVCRLGVGTLTVTREGSRVTRSFQDRVSTIETPREALVFDNEAPMLISQALRLYDRARGGEQRFPLLFGFKTPVDLLLQATGGRTVALDGRELHLVRYRYQVPGGDLIAWADETGRIHLLEVPEQKARLAREGSDTWWQEDAVNPGLEDPLLSTPEHEVTVDHGAGIPMRDGLCLATDIYLPTGVARAPAVLVRTPCKKEILELQANYFARRGYVFAVQDCRGRYGSPGEWEPLLHEEPDGYDAVEWLAARPYCNGRVGMMGTSYLGYAQWAAAAENPPHLAAIIPSVAPTDPAYNVPFEYGAFYLLGAIWWISAVESGAGADISGATLHRVNEVRYADLLRSLPVRNLDLAVFGRENACFRRWIDHGPEDEYWRPAEFLGRLANVKIPVFHQSGWFDGDGNGRKRNYLKMAEHGNSLQKLILGPWGHTDTAERMCQGRDFGEDAVIDLQREYLRWFDRWLKGIENGIEHEPLVRLFVMGLNRWVSGRSYPLEGTEFRRLCLSSGGSANTSRGDGRLSFAPPAGDAAADHYIYDPGDPTPDFRVYHEAEEDRRRVRPANERRREAESQHGRIAEQRADVLVYETEPLERPLTFAGPVSAVIHAETTARDTDWFVTLSEVEADGRIFQLVQGKMRARYRNSVKAPELIQPGETCCHEIDLWHTAISIPAGGRLRVEITSAAFPAFSRNLNAGENNETGTVFVRARQTIFHGTERPSHILLPVIPCDDPPD